jgi:hypothetical protein
VARLPALSAEDTVSLSHLTRAATVAALTAGALLTGCSDSGGDSSEGITADTVCSDYIARQQNERWDAAVRISSELQVQDAGNPMWGPKTDYVCGSNPKTTVGAALGG